MDERPVQDGRERHVRGGILITATAFTCRCARPGSDEVRALVGWSESRAEQQVFLLGGGFVYLLHASWGRADGSSEEGAFLSTSFGEHWSLCILCFGVGRLQGWR